MSKKKRKKARIKKAINRRRTPQKEISTHQPSVTTVSQISEKRPKKIFILCVIPFFIAIIGIGLYFLLSPSSQQVKRNSELNILLVTLDTTRADRIGSYGYERAETPNLDQLALNGVRFANAYCQVPLTFPSHCSLMTGTYPIFHLVHNNGFYYLAPDYLTLAEVLKNNGFETAAFVSSFTVDSRFGLNQGFDVYDDKVLEKQVLKNFASERTAEKVFSAFSSWMDKNFSQKFFCWLHFFDPHSPYDPPSPYKEKYAERPYDGEIAYMDFYVGKTMDMLRQKNLLDSTFIILAGDHGEALGEKNEEDHGLYIYDVTMRVPLIFYSPNYLPQGLILEPRVRLIDIMPTILDMLNIPSGGEVQGTSLLPYISKRKKDDLSSYIETYMPREYYGWSELIGLIDGDWKYIKAPKPELYNLKSDPVEENNVFNLESKIVLNMQDRLNELIENNSLEREAGKRKLTREEQERLRSLGYVGVEFEDDRSKQILPDPKDKIDEYVIFIDAKMCEFEENYGRAEQNFKELLQLNPEAPWHYINLALLYEKMERLDDAIQLMEQARKIIPNSIAILSRLSLFYLKEKKPEDAFKVSQAVFRIDPEYFEALYISAVALSNMQKWNEALSYFQRALKIEPENKSLGIQYAHCLSALGRKKDALEVYLWLKDEYPDDPMIYRDIGVMYDTLGEMEKARENLKRAVELDPSPDNYFNYAVVLERSGQLKDAVHYLRLYLETTREANTEEKTRVKRVLAHWEARLQGQ
jgi:arylsulfatase A-like enzyme/Flp pilus assembly protein TadD